MSFPFLPVNPNCRGCSSSSSSLGCNNNCGQYKLNTDEEVYNGPDLDAIGVKNCDPLTVVLQKINEALTGNTTTSTTSTSTTTATPTTSTTTSSTTETPTTTSTTTSAPILSWYYGTYEVAGGIVEIPDETDIDVSTGTEVNNQDANNPINIPYNSSTIDFLWFALPVLIPIKTAWYVTPSNEGDIGGAVSEFGNLFSDPVAIVYLGQTFNLYITNYRTNVTTMIIS